MIVFMMMAVGLNIVVGYAGLLDLGYVAFYAIGAYTDRLVRLGAVRGPEVPDPDVQRRQLPGALVPKLELQLRRRRRPGRDRRHPRLDLARAPDRRASITALFGILIGLPTLRLRGDYLAIVTLGFGEILPQIARNGDSLGGFNLTNGPNGITPIDPPGFGHDLSNVTGGFLPDELPDLLPRDVFGHQIRVGRRVLLDRDPAAR